MRFTPSSHAPQRTAASSAFTSKQASSGFVADGLRRLLINPDYRRKRAVLEAQIRQKYAGELSAATGYWQRAVIKNKIRRELKQSEPSHYSLWSSTR